MKKFPKEIVVIVENEGMSNDEFLSVHRTVEDAAEHGVKKRAAVYALQQLITIEGITEVKPL